MAQEQNHLFNRLSLRQKFSALGLLALTLIGIAFFAYISNQQAKIDVIKREQTGLHQAKELIDLLQILSRHRSASSALLNDNTSLADEEKATKALADQQLAVFDGLRKSMDNPELQQTWESVQQDWPKITQKLADRSVTSNDNFQSHNQLIAKVLEVLDLLVDHYGLSLDPYAESYFLMRATLVNSPILTEYLDQARSWGTGLLAKAAMGKETASAAPIISLQDRSKLSLMTSIANAQLTAALRDFNKVWTYNPTLKTPLMEQMETTANSVRKAIKLSETEIINKSSPNYNSADYYTLYTQVLEEMSKSIDMGSAELDAMFERQIKAASQQMLTLSAIIVGLLFVCTVVTLFIVGSITKPIGFLVEVMQKLAAGDHGVRANLKTRDEIGLLASQFDAMMNQREAMQLKVEQENEALNNSIVELLLSVAQLAQRDLTVKMAVADDITGPLADALNLLSQETAAVMKQVTQVAHEVAGVSQQVQTQSAQIIDVASAEKREVEQAADELGAASSAMLDIARLAASCNEAAEHAIKNTDQAQDAVLDTINGIDGIRDTIRETERIKRLGERSQEIGGVVNLINEIAERTHILALNAAMHAASAGEAGRGFAVVAGEVQKLAENSREATSKISSLVNNIQLETADTITTMNNAISQVVRGTELAQQAGNEMRETRDTTADLVKLVQTIAASSTRQSEVSQRLVARAQQIQQGTEQTYQQLREQNLQTERLATLSDALVSAVGVFTLPKMST